MKKLFIISLFFLTASTAIGQNGQPAKIQERMREYVQNKLGLSKAESERFTPVFVRYFRDFAKTHNEYKGDRLVFQQKAIELRLRYRDEFRQIMDEQRANKVYKYEDEFREQVIRIIKENRRDNIPAGKRNRSLLE